MGSRMSWFTTVALLASLAAACGDSAAGEPDAAPSDDGAVTADAQVTPARVQVVTQIDGETVTLTAGAALPEHDAHCDPTNVWVIRLTDAAVDCGTNFCIGFPRGVYVKLYPNGPLGEGPITAGTFASASIAISDYRGAQDTWTSSPATVTITTADATHIAGSVAWSGTVQGTALSVDGTFDVPVCQ